MKVRNLTFFLITVLLLVGSVAYAGLSDGLVAYWPFNGNANDEGGKFSHGSVYGATLTTDRFGNTNSAYSFDGINDYIAASADGLPTASRTISLWFYANTLFPPGHLLAYGGSNVCGTSFLMEINNNDLLPKGFEVQSHCRVNRLAYTYDTEPIGEWYHWVVTTDETGTKMYINGIEMASNNNPINNTVVNATTQIAFGTGVTTSGIAPYQDGNAGYFNGIIDDIRIYDRAITEAEIIELLGPELPEPPKPSEDLIAYYPFNGNAIDESGHGNDGIVNGATLTSDRFGNSNSAYSFDGVNDYVKFSATKMPQKDRTVTFWLYTSDVSSNRLMFGYGGNNDSPQYSSFTIYFVSADKRSIEVHRHYPGGNFINYVASSPMIDEWYHLAFTTDSNGSNLYINGQLVLSNNTVISTYVTGKDGFIGAIPTGSGIGPYIDSRYPFFKGKLDDIRIYNFALTGEEIASIYSGVGLNKPPVLDSIGNKTGQEGQPLVFNISATDPDPFDILTFGANNLPDGSSFNSETATFQWVPSFGQAGNYENIEFYVKDDGYPMELDVELITITVGNVNRPPIFNTLGLFNVNEGELLEFVVSANDPDGDDLILSVVELPEGATFNPTTGLFSWIPNHLLSGTYVITFEGTDNDIDSLTSKQEVSITVGDVPNPTSINDALIEDIITEPNLTDASINSYMANLKKVNKFIGNNKITPAINQVFAFICKVQEDISNGEVDAQTGSNFILQAENILYDLGEEPSVNGCD